MPKNIIDIGNEHARVTDEPVSVDAIRAAIRQQGAGWTAGVNRIASMPVARQRSLLLPEPPVREDVLLEKLRAPLLAAPAAVDWRSMSGKSYVSPVKSQVGPTCVAFANTAAVESCVLKSESVAGNDVDLAERIIIDCDPGYPSSVAGFLQSTGLPPESCYPFSATAPSQGWPAQAYRPIAHQGYRALDIASFKALVANEGPLVTGMNVPDDFFSYSGGIYRATVTHLAGFHEVLVIGYDDPSGCFIAKNSWGVDWGEDGFFRIAYSQFGEGPVVGFGVLTDSFTGIVPPRRRTLSVPIVLKTWNGHTVTAVNGGGLGGPNSGPGAVAVHTDATKPGPWETFRVEWLDGMWCALRTMHGTYLSAVNGGGIGGPNDLSCPLHTDASWAGPWEAFTLLNSGGRCTT